MASCFLFYIATGLVILAQTETGVLCHEYNDKVEDLIERFWQWRLREAPEYSTKFGLNLYDDRLQEFTEEAFRRQKDAATDFLIEVINIDSHDDEVTIQNNLSLQVVRNLLEVFISGYKYRKYSMYNNISPLNTPFGAWGTVSRGMKFETVEDYNIYIARLRQNAIQIRNITTLMGEAVQAGLTQNEWALTGVIEKLEAELAKPVNETIWYTAAFPDSNSFENFNDVIKENLTNTIKDVVTGVVIPEWEAHLDFMNTVYKPNTRPGIGASSLPDGENYYQACLKWHLSVDLTAEQVHQMGLDEVARIKTLMEKIMLDENFTNGTLADFIEYLRGIPENFYQGETAGEDMLQGYRDIIDEAHSKMSTLLRKVPVADVEVRNYPNPQGATGRYSSPPLDGSSPGIFWANVFYADTKPKFDMIALALHEAEPGHHTDSAYRLEQDLPYFRRLVEYRNYGAVPFNWLFHTSFGEGWALYAESLGEEMGMYKDNFARFGKYNSEIFRATRLVVDTGMHAFNWTRDEAVNYMRENTAMPHSTIENEINRYIGWPGQACSYKVGELKIQELRKRAAQQLGNTFDLRDFHHEVLSLGPAPLSILETHIDNWVQKVKDSNKKNKTSGENKTVKAATLIIMLSLITYLM